MDRKVGGRVVRGSVIVGESCVSGPGCGNTMGNISSSEPETECQNSLFAILVMQKTN